MKCIYFIVLVFSMLFLSCKGGSSHTINDSVSFKELIARFTPVIQGVWVKSDYINDVVKTRSPYNSRSKLIGTATVVIEKDSIKADSLFVGRSLNNHEGDEFTLYFRKGHKANSLKTNLKDYEVKSNFFELGYIISSNDTSLILYHYNKNAQLLDSTNYTKVLAKDVDGNGADYGIDYITNKELITGKYIMTDLKGDSAKVEFTNNGKVSGFPNFATYYVNTDFMFGLENNLDVIDFNVYDKTKKAYTYKLKGDTINLYSIKEDHDSTLLIIDTLEYKLVRSK